MTRSEPRAFMALFGGYFRLTALSFSLWYVRNIVLSRLCSSCLPLSRYLISLRWKSPVPPSHSSRIRDIFQFVKMEKVRCMIHISLAKFNKSWWPFLCNMIVLQLLSFLLLLQSSHPDCFSLHEFIICRECYLPKFDSDDLHVSHLIPVK